MTLEDFITPEQLSSIRSQPRGTRCVFGVSDLPDVAETGQLHGVVLEIRQRFAPNGLMDNCILSMSRKSSTLVGLWLIAGLLHHPDEMIELTLDGQGRRIRRGRLSTDIAPPSNYEWDVQPNFAGFMDRASNADQLACAKLVGPSGDTTYIDSEAFSKRSVLEFSGRPESIGLIAEFFLNFGHTDCSGNYEYIRSVPGTGPANEESCELRVEICEEP